METLERSRSPRHDSHWIARQVAIFARYPHKRPKNLRVTADGHMYLDDLMRAWGESQTLTESEVLAALRKHATRNDGCEETQRFAIASAFGGRRLIKVSPKQRAGITQQLVTPKQRLGFSQELVKSPRQRLRLPHTQDEMPLVQHNPKCKLDMSLDELIRTNHGQGMRVDAGDTSTKENDSIAPSAVETAVSESKAQNGDHAKNILVAQDERGARVRKSMEQMGLTLATAHIRLPPGAKAATNAIQTVDSSPSPPPSREAGFGSKGAGDDGVDAALAERAAKCISVTGDVHVSHAADDNAKSEPPPKPPGGNWKQFCDMDKGSMWYHWPGPGGEWWCGPNAADEPQPYIPPQPEPG